MLLLRIRFPLCRIALAWAVPIAIATSAAASEPAWLPLAAGNRWVYEVHRDHSYQPANDTIDRIFHGGRSTQVAEPVAARPGAVLVRNTTSLQTAQGGGRELTEGTLLLAFDDGLRLLASSETHPHAKPTEAVFEPPLRLLPATPTTGETWKVGTYREGDLQVPLEGEILGVENLSSDPACTGCLKVRYRGKISGSVPIYQGSAQVESGTFERTMWFERGVGIVRETATTDGQLKLPDGHDARIFVVVTLRLVEHAVAK